MFNALDVALSSERSGSAALPARTRQDRLEPELYAAAEKYQAEIAKVPGRILSVSAMAPWKGADRLIEAMPLVLQNIPKPIYDWLALGPMELMKPNAER